MARHHRVHLPFVLVLLLLTATPASSKLPRSVSGKLSAAAQWINNQLASVAIGMGFDKATGTAYKKDLEEVQVSLRKEVQAAKPGDEVKALQAQLEATTSQVQILDKLLASRPTKEEIARYQKELATKLDRVARVQREQGKRISELEEALAELTQQVEELADDKQKNPNGLPPGPLPEHPVVAVLALGDPTFATPFELELEQRLRGNNVFVKDERGLLAVRDRLRGGAPLALSELAPVLAQNGFHLLVLAEVEVVGLRELQYLGRRSAATQASVRLEALGLIEQRPLGSWNGQVEYTALTAENKTRDVLRDETYDMGSTIGEYWTALRSVSR